MVITCPYCGNPAKLVDGSTIHPHSPAMKKLNYWQCKPCDAYIPCYQADGTSKPIGTMANAELRQKRVDAHNAFDPIWIQRTMSRRSAYAWLAKELKIQIADCQIAKFDLEICDRVIELSLAKRGVTKNENYFTQR